MGLRQQMQRALPGPDLEEPLDGVRTLRPEDARELGRLLFAAYKGTVDDEGESLGDALAVARLTFQGQSGEVQWDCSHVVEGDEGLVGACVVTLYGEPPSPLIAFSMTAPDAQRKGIGRGLLIHSMAALAERGYREVGLVVTAANTRAVRLYESLGFIPVQA